MSVAGLLAMLAAGSTAGASPAAGRLDDPSQTAPVASANVRVRGNSVLNEDVYAQILALLGCGEAHPASAATQSTRLQRFLLRSGYELARVWPEVDGDQVTLHVDEGRVDKIVFLQEGSLQTLKLQLLLDLPHNVFNRPYLERQLQEMKKHFGFVRVSYELVELPHVEHSGPQLKQLQPVPGLDLLPAPSLRELHIVLHKGDWSEGSKLQLRYSTLEGLVAGGAYQGGSWLWNDDRAAFDLAAGARYGETRQEGVRRLGLSLLGAEARWYTPSFAGLRPFLRTHVGLLVRQRLDLDIERYSDATAEAALNLDYELWSGARLAIGTGVQQRWIFSYVGAEEEAAALGERSERLGFAEMETGIDLDPTVFRRDRRHYVGLDTRGYWSATRRPFLRTGLRYQKVLLLGWHEAWVQARGAWIWGEPLLPDEEPVGGVHVRGVFPWRIFARRVFSVATELRWSLVRDLYKVSLYHDFAVYDASVRGVDAFLVYRGNRAHSFGAGFHALVLDAFQLDVYYGWGYSSNLGYDRSISLRARHAY